MDLFKQLHTKSSATKARYAFIIALSVTLIIGFVWSTTLPARLSSLVGTKETKESPEESPKTFTQIFDEAKSQVGAIAEWDNEVEEKVPTKSLDALKVFEDTNEQGISSSTSDEQVQPDIEATTENETVLIPEQESDTAVSTSTPEEPKTILIGIKKSEPQDPPSQDEDGSE